VIVIELKENDKEATVGVQFCDVVGDWKETESRILSPTLYFLKVS